MPNSPSRIKADSSDGTIYSFEGVRGFAALLVAVHHLYGGNFADIRSAWISPVLNGYLFVDLFFLLSGYVICSAYRMRIGGAGDFATFAIRRFGRLFPLLVASSLMYVLVETSIISASNALVSHGYPGLFTPAVLEPDKIPTALEALSTLTLTHGLGLFDRLVINYVSWSINTEFYTYLLFAACALLCTGSGLRRAALGLGVAGIAATVWATVSVHDCFQAGGCFRITYDFGIVRCIGSFFLGAFLSFVRKPAAKRINTVQLGVLVLTLAFFCAIPAMPGTALLSPLIWAMVVYALSGDEGFLARLLQRASFQSLGQRSYSIYMMHPIVLMFFAAALRQVHGSLANLAIALFYLPAVYVVSGWTYQWIEDPFRKYFNRLAAGRCARPRIGQGPVEEVTPADPG